MHIEVRSLAHSYQTAHGSHEVLHEINVDLDQKRIGIIGHNGSGKSTFVRMINGLITPTSGTIIVDGVDVTREPKKVRSFTGFLFTDPDSQIIMPTVAEDIAFGLRSSKLPKECIDAKVAEMAQRYGLTDHLNHPAHLLSGGQKQMLALASVLITEPRLIVMDEPTTLLDIRNARAIGRLIDTLDQTVILATHHLHLLDSFDRVLVFNDGRIVCDDIPSVAIASYEKMMDCD